MHIAFVMRGDALEKPGGDVVQIQQYIEVGRACGLFDGTLVHELDADLARFDIVNLTNVDRPIEAFHFFVAARRLGKPVAITTIHHAYAEIAAFEKVGRVGLAGRFTGLLTFAQLEVFRSLVRAVRRPSLLVPLARCLVRGVKRCQADILQHVGATFVISNKEVEDMRRDFGVDPCNVVLTRNGVNDDIEALSRAPSAVRDVDVFVVGRIEARKNQLKILDAVERLGRKAVFVGQLNRNHREYCERFLRAVEVSSSAYLGGQDRATVFDWMRRAKVHCSASWFEVSSLVDIEAAKCGCVVVSSRCGASNELLGDRALYVDPASTEDIVRQLAVGIARAERGGQVSDDIRFPRWEEAVVAMSTAYRRMMAP